MAIIVVVAAAAVAVVAVASVVQRQHGLAPATVLVVAAAGPVYEHLHLQSDQSLSEGLVRAWGRCCWLLDVAE